MKHSLPLHRGRATAALLVGSYFVVLAALGGYWQWSRLMPVGARGVSVPDFRDLTSAWDCARRGIAVLPVNPCAPVPHSVANWPRLWLLPYHLGLGESSTVPLVVAATVAFFVAAVIALPADAGVGAGLVYGLALCSPAVMLGIYWGNIDIVVFVLVAAAALLLRRRRAGLVAGSAILLLASLLKLFPIAATSALLRQRRRPAVFACVAVVGSWVAYVGANYDYIASAVRATAQSDASSFGMRRFTEWLVAGVNTLSARVAAGVNQHLTPRAWDVSVALLVLVALVIARRRLRSHLRVVDGPQSDRDLDLFWVGASIYVCSYVVFKSWDYRLVFVLLTIPQLLRWAAMRRAAAIVTLLGLFGALWLDLIFLPLQSLTNLLFTPWDDLTRLPPFYQPLPLAAFAQFVLFSGLLAGVVATAPRAWLPPLALPGRRPKPAAEAAVSAERPESSMP